MTNDSGQNADDQNYCIYISFKMFTKAFLTAKIAENPFGFKDSAQTP